MQIRERNEEGIGERQRGLYSPLPRFSRLAASLLSIVLVARQETKLVAHKEKKETAHSLGKRGAFHSTKNSETFETGTNGTEISL